MSDNKTRPASPALGFPEAIAFLHGLVAPGAAAPRDWLAANRLDNAAVEWLRERGLAPHVFYRLAEAVLLGQVAEEPRAVLRLASYIAQEKTDRGTRELQQALIALAAAGITPVLFKGAVLAYTTYPVPACRQMGDLDLWLTGAEMPRGQAALAALGYVEHRKEARPPAFQARHLGELPMKGAHPDAMLVELHWSPFPGVWLDRTAAIDHAGLRQRVRPVNVVGQPALMLAPEDAVIQVAVHLAINHQFGSPWVRGLIDVALLARTQTVDWAVVAERAAAWRVGTAVWLVLQLAAEIVGLAEAAPAIRALAPTPWRAALLGKLVNAKSLLAMRVLSDGPLRYLLLLLLVDRRRDLLRLAARAIWPETSWLTARYGRAGARVRLRHLAAAARGQF